ncbi:MAG: S46 family peptidase [Bacteroidia bacterium]|nr:S46 family peptidase [Bacteroidia bacterium]MCO5253918.1 S46 family peptidase [Bacteroidota bacterium]MCZ2128891.1 S46 family peptidase [Bacteroidia bacterium]
MKKIALLIGCIISTILFSSNKQEEGMFPLSDLSKIDFKKAGFNIQQEDIFNPNGISLTNALVRLGGCTGSFISEDGLIITNHHCAFGAVSRVSTVENNYLEKGFLAKSRNDEIPVGIECKITRSYEDVSSIILKGITDETGGKEREKIITQNTKKLIEEESKRHPDLKIEVSEMFIGITYVLFRYEILTDTRLVYVPPRQVGEFGGESDNWEWPRHTGDFSILRAYSNKDNKAADYSESNVPYKPTKFLKVNPNGVQEEDLVFILGYPGKTFRHQPAKFIEYQEDHLLPFIADWFGFKIKTMMEVSINKGDEARYLNLASTIKSLANVKKNYEGKIQGLKRTNLLQSKRDGDIMMKQWAIKNKMGNSFEQVIDKIDSLYSIKNQMFEQEFIFNFLNNDVAYVQTALTIIRYQNQPKKDLQDFWTNKKDVMSNLLNKRFTLQNQDIEFAFFKELVFKLEKENITTAAYRKAKNKEEWLKNLYVHFQKDRDKWLRTLSTKPEKFEKINSPMISFLQELLPYMDKIKAKKDFIDAQLNVWIPIYTELKYQTQPSNFIPDANSTLRLTYGYIRRYTPNDGEIDYPFTSAEGIQQKYNSGNPDYYLPDNLRTFFDQRQYPEILVDKKSGKPVVCMLYNLDTTGGNSGSPILDKDGNLVGVNFDRTYTATINDYAWNENYSRSVGVDIRYVIYIMKYLSGADHILQEMGVNI